MKDPYEEIAKYYDEIVGKRYELDFIDRQIEKLNPNGIKILDLACGTGEILNHYIANKNLEGKKYSLYGGDRSEKMLKEAKNKLKSNAKFYNLDISEFSIDEKFDIVLCIFNSINHLHDFKLWESMFKSVKNHLNEGGVFIFDIITVHGLKAFLTEPPIIEKKDDKVIVLQYRSAPNDMLDMQVKVFKDSKEEAKSNYLINETYIREQSFLNSEIESCLKKYFKKVKCYDLEEGKVSDKSEVLFWVCS